MIMVDHSKRLSEPLRWTRAGKIGVALVSACLLVGLLTVAIFTFAGSAKEARDCVNVTFASTLGAARLHDCGAQARKVCASPANFRSIENELRESCRRAGFAFRRAG